MNGWDLGGRPIKVGKAISSNPVVPPVGLPGLLTPPSLLGLPGMPIVPSVTIPGASPAQVPSAAALAQAIAAKKAEESLSHEENITLSNPNQRYALMQKLARGATAGKVHVVCISIKRASCLTLRFGCLRRRDAWC